MSDAVPSARDGALAKLAAEAARFAAGARTAEDRLSDPVPQPAPLVRAPRPVQPARTSSAPPGYVPVAVAPERGNTRPVVPVDGRIHMRIAQATVDALDDAVRAWRASDPSGLRDLERATLIRVGIALALTDIAQHGRGGAVGEAIRAALDPVARHTDRPMPDLVRWLRASPQSEDGAARTVAGRPAAAASG